MVRFDFDFVMLKPINSNQIKPVQIKKNILYIKKKILSILTH
jgi:hypothetical protein